MVNQQQIDALSVDQLWDAVCLAHRECKGAQHEFDGSPHVSFASPCFQCYDKGPKLGRVWALPGMQKKCGCLVWAGKQVPSDVLVADGLQEYHRKANIFCHGTGWVAKRDLGALLEFPYEIHFTRPPGKARCQIIYVSTQTGFGRNREQALLRAVAKALVQQGAELT